MKYLGKGGILILGWLPERSFFNDQHAIRYLGCKNHKKGRFKDFFGLAKKTINYSAGFFETKNIRLHFESGHRQKKEAKASFVFAAIGRN